MDKDIEGLGPRMLLCVSRIVAFIVKNINTKILFACLVGWVNSSIEEIKKFKARKLKYGLSCIKTDVSELAHNPMHCY